MSTVAEYFGKIESAITGKAEAALEISEIFQFNVTGDGGGTWTIDLKQGPAVAAAANDDATCVITLDAEDFLGLMSGEKNGMELFATGRLTLERDAMAAMKLEKLLRM
jgi:putative sterol carrier protein